MSGKRRQIVAVVVIFSLSAVAMSYFYSTQGAQVSILEVAPGYEFYQINSTFDVDIYCKPIEPVKAYEFKLSFDPTKLEAISVQEGDFFLGYATFFRPGIINNTAGTIINIYGLILGQGNISTPGVLVTVTFKALNDTGVSNITIYDDGICNETQYISYRKNDGKAQIYTGCPPWDVCEDGIINIIDVSVVVFYYGETCIPGDAEWDICADGNCNIRDISIVISHYGEMY
jgi:hypothetical protein